MGFENHISKMASVRSSTRLETDGHKSEMLKIVRLNLGSWRAGRGRVSSSIC